MVRKAVAIVFAVALLGSSAAFAQTRESLQIYRDIADRVNRYTQFTIFDSVSASIDKGHVVLTGWVTMPYKRDDIERRVARVEGVESITNEIGVLPVSQFDNELRFRIARAIYGNRPSGTTRPWPTRRFTSWSTAGT